MKYGYADQVLRIDLTTTTITRHPLSQELIDQYLGGRGFVAKVLHDELPKDINPLSPDNIFVMATGPLSGHLLPSSGKTHFGCKSPATGGYGDSNMGGHFGPAMKHAGYDMMILTGKAEKPSLLIIENGNIDVRDAGELWGMGSITAEKKLKEMLGEDFQIMTIGPAGENLVLFSCITHDFGRQAGRVGIGAVLGSKNIKAIAVKGTGSIPVPDPAFMLAEGKKAYQAIRNKPGFKGWTPEGTAGITNWLNRVGAIPTKNFSTSYWDQAEKINGAAILKELKITDKGCYCCPTPCGKYGKAKTKRKQVFVEGPEFETIGLLGSNVLLNDIHEVAYANYVCDELGLDTISAGVVVSWALECVEKGILKDEDFGREIRFKDIDSVEFLLELIASREKLGDLLAQGVKKASETTGRGSEDFAIQVKGLEWSGYECRNAPGMMLAYMTSDIGAHHARAWVLGHDLAGTAANVHDLISSAGEAKPLPKSDIKNKAGNVVASQHLRPLFDLLGVCRLQYMELGFEVDNYETLFTAVTGKKMSWDEMLTISERVWHLTRLISVREVKGYGRHMDYPPARFMNEPVPDGPNKGHCLNKPEVDALLDDYYTLRGWDMNGIPTPEKLKELGLKQ